jgi:ribosomal protein S18 acetylase RimI-like enzyme
MQIAVLTFDGFNELDSFIAAPILNRLRPKGWKAFITAPSNAVTSMNGVTVQAERELEFAAEADAVPRGLNHFARRISGCCEMKRLYVCPEGRGSGLRKGLVEVLVEVAERIGYREMMLDTLPSMAGAQALYRRLGFEVIEPYYETPVVGTLSMCRRLEPRSGAEQNS